METITTYVNNMFGRMPEDERLTRAKEDLLSIMEEHYNDLKAEGKSENEAIGTVISQFGNIDELLEELGVSEEKSAQPAESQPAQPDNSLHLTENEALEYISYRKRFGWRMAIGVMLCILAPAALIAVETLLSNLADLNGDMSDGLALVALLSLIAAAVSIFVINGIKNQKYECYEKMPIALSDDTARLIAQKRDSYTAPFALSICFGLVCIFAGVITVGAVSAFFDGIDLAEELSASALLALVAVGVMLMAKAGIVNESYKHLLNIEKNGSAPSGHVVGARPVKEGKGVIGAKIFTAILWPLVVLAFLVWSFMFDAWHISWILFPAAGILTGIVNSVVNIVNGEEK